MLHSSGKEQFRGKITIMDVFSTFRPISLNVKISVNKYPKIGKTTICFEFSPKSFDHPIWNQLDKQREDFTDS
jgi:hypothetical protein